MKKILLLYIPVIHAGYLRLIEKYQDKIEALYIVGEEFIDEFCDRKEIRALDPKTVEEMLDFGSRLQVEISTLSRADLKISLLKSCGIITIRDELCQAVVEKYFPGQPVEYDTVFLRWDRTSVFSQTSASYDRVSESEFDRKMMSMARVEADKTSDWWRQVGAVLVNKDGIVVCSAYNHHMPSDHQPYFAGDPRDFVKTGERGELCSALHAEQGIIANAARFGTSLDESTLYVNVFPCPVCAKLIAASGIRRLYFSEGHASLDGETVLKEAGVEIILVR